MTSLRLALTGDKAGGALLLLATVAALVLANSPASDTYTSIRDFAYGPDSLHLRLSVGEWAADGLLAIFFFVVGLELKQEFLTGSLRRPRAAAIPVAAALGGVAAPAALYLLINATASGGATEGWAIPAATDIAFAVSILAVVGSQLPAPVRAFLLTLAVVDDLLAISIIAIGYTESISLSMLCFALLPLACFAILVQRRVTRWWLLVPPAVCTWVLIHASGVHATVAGVLLAFTVPVIAGSTRARSANLSAVFAHRLQPWSSTLAVPVFAFFAAGVAVGGLSGLGESYTDPVAVGIIVALIVGKPVGILAATYVTSRLPGMSLDAALRWRDLAGVAMLAGIGFTVSLLIGELAFGVGDRDDHVKVGVLTGSLIAAAVATVYLAARNKHYRDDPPRPDAPAPETVSAR
ncbi:Na+/H+ antiporter NhaA [Gordonia sp. 'Campus']|uniref:Na+/H+ antiporter NhaA n=1 Tax=Gordonia sp. 'Campus' TaxID=2915824 RepID=UPI001EE3CAB6|nr:Na+/H+ antiporter NhaA [Gordonia sp. 'Campus']